MIVSGLVWDMSFGGKTTEVKCHLHLITSLGSFYFFPPITDLKCSDASTPGNHQPSHFTLALVSAK